MPHNRFADFIRGRRAELGLSITELSSRCGFPRAAITDMETGQKPPDLILVPGLATVLQIDPAVLCRLALLIADGEFYGLLVGEPDTMDLTAACDPALARVVEVDTEDADWVRQLRQMASQHRHLLRQLAAELLESSRSKRRRVSRGQILLEI